MKSKIKYDNIDIMETKDKLHNLRHSLAHLLAAAVLEIYPDTKNTIGPSNRRRFLL